MEKWAAPNLRQRVKMILRIRVELPKLPSALILFLFLALSFSTAYAQINLEDRERGVSVYLVPENVTEKANAEHVQRFVIAGNERMIDAYAQTAEDLIAGLLKTQPSELKYGIWLVLTHPASYSQDDNQEKAALEELARKHGITLYACRGSELPEGWQQVI